MIDNEKLKQLVKTYNTPMYLYDKEVIEQSILDIKKLKVCDNVLMGYATKANNNKYILDIIKNHNFKFDACSIGEVKQNLNANIDLDDIYVVCNNVSIAELKELLELDIIISVDSIDQLKTLIEINPSFQKLCLRVNPSIGAGENDAIVTGGYNHKFGIDIGDLNYALELINKSDVKLIGINQHIGSLNLDYNDFVMSINELLSVVTSFNLDNLEIINFGGGFGINYNRHDNDNTYLDLDILSDKIDLIFKKFLAGYKNQEVSLCFEPGRYIVATSSILVGEVTSIKHRSDNIYIGTNLGFNNFMRPTLYDSYHHVEIISDNSEKQKLSVVGNMCESGDYICKDRELILPNVGDLVVVYDTGAYGYCMANNYNSRLKPIEILKDCDEFSVIRERQKIEDLF